MSHIEIDRRKIPVVAYAGKERRVPSVPAKVGQFVSSYGGPERRSRGGVSPTGKERRNMAGLSGQSLQPNDAFARHQELLAQQQGQPARRSAVAPETHERSLAAVQGKPEPPVSPDPAPKRQGWF